MQEQGNYYQYGGSNACGRSNRSTSQPHRNIADEDPYYYAGGGWDTSLNYNNNSSSNNYSSKNKHGKKNNGNKNNNTVRPFYPKKKSKNQRKKWQKDVAGMLAMGAKENTSVMGNPICNNT